MFRTAYAALFLILLALWPFIFGADNAGTWLLFFVNVAVSGFVWWSCSSPACSYWEGLELISGNMMCGCANITICYIFPLLAVVHLIATFYAVEGLVKGREVSGKRWLGLVNWFCRKR